MPFDPRFLILHDYGRTPSRDKWQPGQPLSFNPYHALVHGGQVQYRNPSSPYSQKAPHAYRLNPQSVGLSWAGPVGGTPNPADRAALVEEVRRIRKQYPGIQAMGHGEAYEKRGAIPQASKHGRNLAEASWRTAVLDDAGDYSAPPGIGPGGMARPAPTQQPDAAVVPRPIPRPTPVPGPIGMPGPEGPQLRNEDMANGQGRGGNMFGFMRDPMFHAGISLLGGSTPADAMRLMGRGYNEQERIAEAQRRFEAGQPLKQAQLELAQARAAAAREGPTETFSKTPFYGTDAGGKPVMMLPGDLGSVKQLEMPPGVTPAKGTRTVDMGTKTAIIDSGTGRMIGVMDKNLAGAAAEKVKGAAAGKAQVSLPGVEREVGNINRYLDNVLNHPGFDWGTDPYRGRLPSFSKEARSFDARMRQIQGKAFVNAFDRLKGAGAITETEGRAAAEALGRLQDPAIGPEEFKLAVADFRREVAQLVAIARERGAMGRSGGGAQGGGSGGWGAKRLD